MERLAATRSAQPSGLLHGAEQEQLLGRDALAVRDQLLQMALHAARQRLGSSRAVAAGHEGSSWTFRDPRLRAGLWATTSPRWLEEALTSTFTRPSGSSAAGDLADGPQPVDAVGSPRRIGFPSRWATANTTRGRT